MSRCTVSPLDGGARAGAWAGAGGGVEAGAGGKLREHRQTTQAERLTLLGEVDAAAASIKARCDTLASITARAAALAKDAEPLLRP